MDELLQTEEGLNEIEKIANHIRGTDGAPMKRSEKVSITMSAGCTAVVAIITKTHIYCANSGDSRCVLGRAFTTHELSDDHKPDNIEERERIEAAGGFVEEGRVRGILSLSRALGDLEYKQSGHLPVEKQMITCVPDRDSVERKNDDQFLILACDGIWDCLTSQEAVQMTR